MPLAICGHKLWAERLGLALPQHSVDIWIHAASAGEMKSLVPLLQHLYKHKEKYKPKLHIHLSSTTASGYAVAKSFIERFSDFLSYSCLPIDIPFLMALLCRRLQARLLLVCENDHWPNMLKQARKHHFNNIQTDIFLINGRVSQASFVRFQRWPKVSQELLKHYTYIFCKSQKDYQHYRQLVSNKKSVLSCGDLKFDAPLFSTPKEEVHKLRAELGLRTKDYLIVAGSTRPGEESIWVDVLKKLQLELEYRRLSNNHARILLLLAPRHTKRVKQIYALLHKNKLSYYSYSQILRNNRPPKEAEKLSHCIIHDMMGHLQKFYAIANLAFVGGTFGNTGGHNLLEPVWMGTPVIFGPDTRNVNDLADYVMKHNYGLQVQNKDELYHCCLQIIQNKKKLRYKTKNILSSKAPTHRIADYIFKVFTEAGESPS